MFCAKYPDPYPQQFNLCGKLSGAISTYFWEPHCTSQGKRAAHRILKEPRVERVLIHRNNLQKVDFDVLRVD
jgi:hypothetical protein